MTPFSLPDILSRIADLVGAKTDSDLAGALGVTRQTFATWKRRGKVPFEEICEFAQQRDISLDYLLLGKKENKARIDQAVFKEIQRAFNSEYSAYRDLPSADFSYRAVIFYNQYADIEDLEKRRRRILTALLFAGHESAKEEYAKKARALLDDEEKFRIAMNKIWGQTEESESGNAHELEEKLSIQPEPAVSRRTAKEDKRIGRDVVPKGEKKKKK